MRDRARWLLLATSLAALPVDAARASPPSGPTPEPGAALRARADELARTGDPAAALTLLEDGTRSAPAAAHFLWMEAGRIALAAGWPDRAARAFRRAGRGPEEPERQLGLARAALAAGDWPRARLLAERLAGAPEPRTRGAASAVAGRAAARLGDEPAALLWLARAAADPGSPVPDALALAEHHFARGDLARALAAARDAGRRHPGDPSPALLEGRVAAWSLDPVSAREAWKRAASLAPRDVEIAAGLAVSLAHLGATDEARRLLDASEATFGVADPVLSEARAQVETAGEGSSAADDLHVIGGLIGGVLDGGEEVLGELDESAGEPEEGDGAGGLEEGPEGSHEAGVEGSVEGSVEGGDGGGVDGGGVGGVDGGGVVGTPAPEDGEGAPPSSPSGRFVDGVVTDDEIGWRFEVPEGWIARAPGNMKGVLGETGIESYSKGSLLFIDGRGAAASDPVGRTREVLERLFGTPEAVPPLAVAGDAAGPDGRVAVVEGTGTLPGPLHFVAVPLQRGERAVVLIWGGQGTDTRVSRERVERALRGFTWLDRGP